MAEHSKLRELLNRTAQAENETESEPKSKTDLALSSISWQLKRIADNLDVITAHIKQDDRPKKKGKLATADDWRI